MQWANQNLKLRRKAVLPSAGKVSVRQNAIGFILDLRLRKVLEDTVFSPNVFLALFKYFTTSPVPFSESGETFVVCVCKTPWRSLQ